MSWDNGTVTKQCKCACGNGSVVQTTVVEEDDWNRSREVNNNIDIQCDNCSKHYHIEKIVKHMWVPSWVGNGIYTSIYLVPNGKTIPKEIEEKSEHFYYTSIDEEIVAKHNLNDIKKALEDIKSSKYSTRLKLDVSYSILSIYKHKYKRVGLTPIAHLLSNIIDNYDNYEWNIEKIREYKSLESKLIADRNNEIQSVLNDCYLLNI